MPITSLVVECVPGRRPEVVREAERLPMTEVGEAVGDSFVVVLDTPDRRRDREAVDRLAALAGVVAAIPVFTNSEDALQAMEV